jgi:hypothetical protein
MASIGDVLDVINSDVNIMQNLINDTINMIGGDIGQLQRTSTSRYQGADSTAGSPSNYTTKLFGAPFQLLDSVDKRFKNFNSDVGSEYLKNFLLNSPILYIQPGIPHYTGGESGESVLSNLYKDTASGNLKWWQSLLTSLFQKKIFDGDNLQKRMFELKERYFDYMKCVNYMCRSVAVYMELTKSNTQFPNFTFTTNNKPEAFETMRWENYRMMKTDYVPTPRQIVGLYLRTNTIGSTIINLLSDPATIAETLLNETSNNELLSAFDMILQDSNATMFDVYSTIPKTVQFMVEPVSFEESISNHTEPSAIESMIDSISSTIGSEIAFIRGSEIDSGILDELAGIIGGGVSSASQAIGEVIEVPAGGFAGSLFRGAINSVKGQKMIYPDIYKSSKSSMDYNFTVTLTSPYGDMYNYYMNIVVPLLHLIALVAPRMTSSNSIASPFLVRAYIPGMCTCDLGIIENMSITKNPTGKHVSINGYPLTIKVSFTIKELYNALAISPGDNPVSFLFNETLNDYLCNLAAMIPSLETHARVRTNLLQQVGNYFDEWSQNNLFEGAVDWANDLYNFYDS